MTAKEDLFDIVQAWHGEFCMACTEHSCADEVQRETNDLYDRIRNGD